MGLFLGVILFAICASLTFSGDMFDSKGKPFAKVAQQTREPKVVIDTIEIRAGWGSMEFNDLFTRKTHNVAPTSLNDLFVSITVVADDSASLAGASMRQFGYTLSKDKKRLIVRSSVTNDTIRAVVTAYVK